MSVLRERTFRRFFYSQAFSYVGDGLRLVAMPLLIFRLTGSALAIGVTYALELGTFGLFGLLGGSLADRMDRRALTIGADLVRLGVLALFCVGLARGALTVAELYAGIVVISIAAAVFLTAQVSIVRYVLGPERAVLGVSLLMTTEQTGGMLLPPLGGALFALLGPLPALAGNAATYLASAVCLSTVPTLGPDAPTGRPSLRELAADVAGGFRFLVREPAMRAFAAVSVLGNFFAMFTITSLVPLAKRTYGQSDATVGYAYGAIAIGGALGAWLAGRTAGRVAIGPAYAIAYAVSALAFAPALLARSLPVALVTYGVLEACWLFQGALIVSWRMRVTPEPLVGSVTGAVRLVILAATVPGAIASGAVADRYGARVAIAIAAAGFAAIAAIVAAVPRIRRERR